MRVQPTSIIDFQLLQSKRLQPIACSEVVV